MSAKPLASVEDYLNALVAKPSLVVIDDQDAALIYQKFQGAAISPSRVSRFRYRAFLQAAMMTAIDATHAIGYVEAIFKSAFMKPVVDAKSMGKVLRKLASHALKNLWKHAATADVMASEVYSMTLVTIAFSCKPYFLSIKNQLDI